jgi:phosphopantetheinyl transferase (holo-ACP synthase)
LIGNDLMDLQKAAKDSDWTRKGYLDKLFTASEQFLISAAAVPNQMVWLLWSMKEAAYKAHTRNSGLRSFAPSSLQCNNLRLHQHQASGEIQYEDQIYYSLSDLNDNYIHTLAARQISILSQAQVVIKAYDPSDTTYRNENADSVSHHGSYLALVFI